MFIQVGVLLTSVALISPVSAIAQARTADPRGDSLMHFGAIYLKPTINLKEIGIDTNVFYEALEPKSDFTFTIAPQLITAVPFAGRGLLRLRSGVDAVYYRKYKSERSLNPNFDLRGEFYLNRLTLFAQPSYFQIRERPSSEIDKRSRRVEQGSIGGAELRVMRKLLFEASVQQTRTTYDADEFFLDTSISEMLNRNSITLGGTARWVRTPLTTVVARIESTHDRFLVSPIRDADSLRVMSGFELKPRALISGAGLIGIRSFDPNDPTVPQFKGLVASASLAYTLLGHTTFGLTVNRDVNYSLQPRQPYYLATSWGITIQRHVVGKFSANVSYDRYFSSYRERLIQNAPPTELVPTDIGHNYGANIGYRVGDVGRLDVGLSFNTRQSGRDILSDYSRLRFTSSFTHGN